MYPRCVDRFFWSISPLAPAAMTEELVRFALTSPDDGYREDHPLTLNVYVCLLFGIIIMARSSS